jgi:translation initiation factor SUI1
MDNNNVFFDPLAELNGNIEQDNDNSIKKEKVHIRKQQRNRRKCIITVSGLGPYLDNNKKKMKKIAKELQKSVTHSSVALKEDKEYGMVLVIQGDWRKKIKEWLINSEFVSKDNVILHGD